MSSRHVSSAPSPARLARIIAFMAMASILGCGDRAEPLGPDYRAFTGKWNGDAWSGRGYAVIRHDTLFLVGHRSGSPSYYDEYVGVTTVFTGIGVYAIRDTEGRLSAVVGGDAGYFPSASGILSITSDRGDPRMLEGTLSLTSTNRNLPWSFRDGRFRVQVYGDFDEVPPAPCVPAVRCEPGGE